MCSRHVFDHIDTAKIIVFCSYDPNPTSPQNDYIFGYTGTPSCHIFFLHLFFDKYMCILSKKKTNLRTVFCGVFAAMID